MRLIARRLKSLNVTPELVLSSPYLRAHETAKILVEEIDSNIGLIIDQNLSPMGDLKLLIEDINQNYTGLDSIAVVGHEPQMSSLVSVLISGNATLDVTMKKGGVCCLSISALCFGRCASLEWLLPPRILTDPND
jgi:phosphohistidine phosphatase